MSMKSLNQRLFATTWKSCRVVDRIDDCRLMLKMHEFITESESDKIIARMDKWVRMHGLKRKQK